MEELEPITLTVEQLKNFYKLAYDNGRNARLVCGGLSSMPKVTDSTLAIALYKTFTNKPKG